MNVDAGQSGVDVRNRVTRSVPIVGAMLAGLLALLSWAFASPVASAPDDDLQGGLHATLTTDERPPAR